MQSHSHWSRTVSSLWFALHSAASDCLVQGLGHWDQSGRPLSRQQYARSGDGGRSVAKLFSTTSGVSHS
jgi:hypothetical protein